MFDVLPQNYWEHREQWERATMTQVSAFPLRIRTLGTLGTKLEAQEPILRDVPACSQPVPASQ